MKFTVLGCGDAFGSSGRFNTSFLLSDHGEHVLIDCGASTLIRLKQEGVDLESISTIIISHFHGDHYGGVPFFLISSMFEMERTSPLTIVGPPDIKNKVLTLLDQMYEGTIERMGGFQLHFVEFKTGKEIQVSDKAIKALRVEHSPPSDPHGIRLTWREKVFAFSGDTSWTDNLIKLSDGADLFVCECNFLDQQAFGHLSYRELVEKKSSLTAKEVWLTHMGNEVLTMKESIFNRLADGMQLDF